MERLSDLNDENPYAWKVFLLKQKPGHQQFGLLSLELFGQCINEY